jgi:hypothetical protein
MLADMVEKGQPQYELAELSLRALEICEAAYLSHRHRSVVGLPLFGFMAPSVQVSGEALAQVCDPGAAYRGWGGRNGRRLRVLWTVWTKSSRPLAPFWVQFPGPATDKVNSPSLQIHGSAPAAAYSSRKNSRGSSSGPKEARLQE